MPPRDRRARPAGSGPLDSTRTSPDVAGRIILCLVIAVVYPRLYFGLAFFDEAFNLALPYSFSLGYRPFLDENAVQQLAALLIQPFVETYLAAVGSNAGLVLFSRHLFLAAALVAAWTVRGFWARVVGERAANLLAAVVLAYVPFCIFVLSYNTLAYLGLLAGTALLARACLPGNRPLHLFFATLCLAVAAFSYPTTLPVAGFALAMGLAGVLRICDPEERAAALAWTAAAALGSVALGGGYLLALDLPEAFAQMVEISDALGLHGGGAVKGYLIGQELSFQTRFLVLLTLALLALGLGVSRTQSPKLATFTAVLAWPTLAYVSTHYRIYHAPFTTVPFVLSLLGLAAPALGFVSRESFSREQRIGLAIITWTSVAAGLVILWSTDNGLRNAALGFTPAAIVTLACIAERTRPVSRSDDPGERLTLLRGSRLPFTILMVSLLSFQLHQLWSHAYREFIPRILGPSVESGAWKGIKTTPRKVDFIAELQSDLDRVRGDAQSIIFFDAFPAGYLMSDLKPATPSLWLVPNRPIHQGNARLRKVYADRLRSRSERPDLVVRLHCIPARPVTRLKHPESDPVSASFDQSDYETVVERKCYSVAKQRPRG